jgi:hypothetical protein
MCFTTIAREASVGDPPCCADQEAQPSTGWAQLKIFHQTQNLNVKDVAKLERPLWRFAGAGEVAPEPVVLAGGDASIDRLRDSYGLAVDSRARRSALSAAVRSRNACSAFRYSSIALGASILCSSRLLKLAWARAFNS